MKVKVYWNLHKKCFSVQHKGKVIEYTDHIILVNAEFKVSQAGRARVLREQRKNVHAFVVGEYYREPTSYLIFCSYTKVSYDPYKNDSFVDSQGNKITKAEQVMLQFSFDENFHKKPVVLALTELT